MKPKILAVCTGLLAAAAVLLSASSAAQEPQETYVNPLGMTFVKIPAGAFLMGSPGGEAGRDPSEGVHRVRISRPFFMQTTEVTLGQWWTVMGKKFMFGRKGDKQMPVNRVSWFDAQEFIRRLNSQEKKRYRLPTEAEWEYACRAGTTTAYSWGEAIDCEKAMYANSPMKYGECVARHRAAGLLPNEPAPVGRFQPNPWGLYDMHGNLWEWCSDWFTPYSQTRQTDPTGAKTGDHRVRRGGSWFGTGRVCRSANRAFGHPAQRLRTTGFRLVLEVDE